MVSVPGADTNLQVVGLAIVLGHTLLHWGIFHIIRELLYLSWYTTVVSKSLL